MYFLIFISHAALWFSPLCFSISSEITFLCVSGCFASLLFSPLRLALPVLISPLNFNNLFSEKPLSLLRFGNGWTWSLFLWASVGQARVMVYWTHLVSPCVCTGISPTVKNRYGAVHSWQHRNSSMKEQLLENLKIIQKGLYVYICIYFTYPYQVTELLVFVSLSC